MKKTFNIALALLITLTAGAQKKAADTVVVELAKTSKVVFTMRDKSDLPQLKQYDFQALFTDIITKLENDSTPKTTADSTNVEKVVRKEEVLVNWDEEDDDDRDRERRNRYRGSRHSFNFDFGTNNFLEDGDFPDASGAQHAVRPWGSWYIGLNSVQRTRITNKFYIEWGVGASWYNFKFQDDATIITKDLNDVKGVYFEQDPREASNDVSFIKSKLTASYINVSMVPMIDVGGYHRKARFWDSNHSAFRLGVGPYAGYRIGSHTKLVYKEDGNREKDKDRDNFYLNNFRYGVRVQLGIRSTDFFFNYDLNELFVTNKGPKLNAFSFGVIF